MLINIVLWKDFASYVNNAIVEGRIENVEALVLSLFYERTLIFTSKLLNIVFWKNFASSVNNAIVEGRLCGSSSTSLLLSLFYESTLIFTSTLINIVL